MNSNSSTDVIAELSTWTVGGGILLTALAPLSLPILMLTAVAVIPLVAPVLAVVLAVALVAAPILLARRLVRSLKPRTRFHLGSSRGTPGSSPAKG
jgi:membrane protein implicated in regulation of membrane protease activity